jgi:hypothetical protein
MTFAELRREYDADVIGVGIWALTCDLAATVARRYPADVYNRGENWSKDSFIELAQDVVTDRLLGERQLDYLFDTATEHVPFSVELRWRPLVVQAAT